MDNRAPASEVAILSPPPERAPGAAVADRRDVRKRNTLLLLAAAGLHGLLFLVLVPLWMGEDEPWHFEYARHVAAGYQPWGGVPAYPASEGRPDDRTLLPANQLQVRRRFKDIPHERIVSTQREILDSMARHDFQARVDWTGAERALRNFDQVAPDFTAAAQPPLYYALAGRWLALLPTPTIEAELWATRALSWVLFVLGAWACLGFAREVFADEHLALLAALVAVWMPMHARQAALVNNDVLVRTLATFVLWLSARWALRRGARWELVLAGGLCLMALLTKTTGAGCAGVLVLALYLRSRAVASSVKPMLVSVAIAALASTAALLWVLQHNPAMPRTLDNLFLRLESGLSWATAIEMWRTLVGSFNWYSRDLGALVYALVGAVALVGLGSSAAGIALPPRGTSRRMLVLCLAAVGFQLLLVVLRGVAAGRYLMPAIAAFAALLVAGLVGPMPAALRPRAAWVLGLALVAYETVFVWGGLVPHEHLLWSW